jgi:hypothetical protein
MRLARCINQPAVSRSSRRDEGIEKEERIEVIAKKNA